MCIFCFKYKKSEQDKRWRKENKEKKATIDKEYQINNKHKISQKKKEYYLINKSKFIERNIADYPSWNNGQNNCKTKSCNNSGFSTRVIQ
jgi:hypothetical protein